MDPVPSSTTVPRRSPLLSPGVVAVSVQWTAWLLIPAFFPGFAILGILGMAIGGLVVVLWWLFLSRLRRADRLGAIVLIAVGLIATSRFVDESIANGMMGNALYALSI